MNTNQVAKLNFTGQRGEEYFLVVDFATRQASVVVVEPPSGNIRVTDVQSMATRGI